MSTWLFSFCSKDLSYLEYERDIVLETPIHLLDITTNKGRTFDALMTSLGFLRLGDYNSGRLADRIQAVVSDDRSTNARVLARVVTHHDC